MRLFIFAIMLLMVSETHAQNYLEDMQKVSDNYAKLDQKKIKLVVKAYAKGSNKPENDFESSIVRQGLKYYSQMGTDEMLVTEKSVMMVDNKQKSIVYRSITSKEAKIIAAKQGETAKINPSLLKNDSVRFEMESGRKKYTVYSAKSPITKAEVYLNSTEYRIEKMIYHYNDKLSQSVQRVDIMIEYAPIDEEAKSKLAEEAFLAFKSNQLVGTNKYAGYEISIAENE